MRRMLGVATVMVAGLFLGLRAGAAVWYVDAAAAGSGNGSTWADAYTDLQSALGMATSNDEVRVAAGTYLPSDTGDRTASFTLKPGMRLAGGYPVGGGARDWTANVTTLSGDIGISGDATDNCAHVVVGADQAQLDGFTITQAYWDSNDTGWHEGGGLYIDANRFMTVANCRFIDNHSWYRGAGIYFGFVNNSTVGPLVTNCYFQGNSTTYGGAQGAALYTFHRVPVTIVDSTFVDNTSADGAAIWSQYCDLVLRRCVFARNVSVGTGGALWLSRGDSGNLQTFLIADCLFYANRSTTGHAGAMYLERVAEATNDVIRNCRFYANDSSQQGGAVYFYRYMGSISDCVFSGNHAAGGEGGAIINTYSSTAYRRVAIIGNTSGYRGGGVYLAGHPSLPSSPSFENVLMAGNVAAYDGGGLASYYLYGYTSTVVNCTITSNRTVTTSTSYGGGGIALQDTILEITNSILYGNVAGSGVGNALDARIATSQVLLGYNDLEGGLAGVNNPNNIPLTDQGGSFDASPLFAPSLTGSWTQDGAYTNATGETTLRDDNTTWATNALVGRFLNPNRTNSLSYFISANGDHTISVLGNAAAGTNGAAYEILDYRLGPSSPCVDAGNRLVAPTNDLAGDRRPRGLTVDLGAYESSISGDGAAPGPVTDLMATGGQARVTLSWTNPGDSDFAAVLVLRRVGAAPTGTPTSTNTYFAGMTIGDGVVAYMGPGSDATPGNPSGFTDVDLDDQITYHYKVFALDHVPNYAVGTPASATTEVDLTPPAALTGLAATAADAQITLTWTNPPQVDYAGVLVVRRTGAPPTGSPSPGVAYALHDALGDGTVVYVGPASDHTPKAAATWTDYGLPNETNYYYHVYAYDEVPLYAAAVRASAYPLAQSILYVNINAAGGGDGTSWASAYNDLAAALAAARSGSNLWVAQGTYTPGTTRAAAFPFTNNCGVYGGFAGTENSVTLRDSNAHPTILSGEIGDPTNADNCLHVVTGTGADGAVLDGFTVTRGYAWDSANDNDPFRDGGGLLVLESSAAISTTVRNCRFVDNAANFRGGALAFLYNSGSATAGAFISNCVFDANYTFRSGGGDQGGAIYKYHYRPAWIFNTVFTGNRSSDGGAISDNLGDLILRHCTFLGNVSTWTCGAIHESRNSLSNLNNLEIADCVFAANRAVHYGAVRLERNFLTGDIIRNCQFYGNQVTGSGASALHLYTYGGLVENVLFSGNPQLGGGTGGALMLEYSGATLRNITIVGTESQNAGGGLYALSHPAYVTPLRCENMLIAGNQTRYYGGGACVYDFGGNTSTWVNCTIAYNRTTENNPTYYGGGGFYGRSSAIFMTNSILYANAAPAGSQVFLSLPGTQLQVGYDDLQGGIGAIAVPDGATVGSDAGLVDAPPVLHNALTGAWTATPVYAATNGMTAFMDAGADWLSGKLAGKFLNPNASVSNLLFYIVANTTNTITILGDASASTNHAAYQIRDFTLKATSPCVDSGLAAGVTNDLVGVARPQGLGFDMGAYERVPDGIMPVPVTGLAAVSSLDTVTLTWTNSTSPDSLGVLILRSVGAPPDTDPVSTNEYVTGQVVGNATAVYLSAGASGIPGAGASWIDTPRDHLTTFDYAVYALDEVPNYSTRADASATTPVDAVAPPPVTGLAVVGDRGQVVLTWTNSVAADLKGVLIVRRGGAVPPTGVPSDGMSYGFGSPIGDGTVVYVGAGADPSPGAPSGWTDTGVNNLTHYAYAVYAYDEVPNYSTGSVGDAHTGLPGTVFVDHKATGRNDGISWQDAYTSLCTAAATNGPGWTYWVSEGTYYPDSTNDPIAVQYNDIFLGGFSATETDASKRNWYAHPTIISGDWTGDHVSDMRNQPLVYWNLGDGSYSATMDGFILEYGRNDNVSGPCGGGIGVHVSVANGSMYVRHCIFRHNSAGLGGGAAHNYGDSRFENCLFYDNQTSYGEFGGGMYLRRGRVAFVNCTFMGNSASGSNGYDIRTIDTVNGSAFDALNSIFYSAPGSLFQANSYQASSLNSCDAYLPHTSNGTKGQAVISTFSSIDADPQFVSPATGDFHLQRTSPCVNTAGGGGPVDDLEGGARPVGAGYDMGAYEYGAINSATPPTGLILLVR